MLNKNTQGAKNEAKSEAPVSYHPTKKCDIWWRPRPKLLYISEGSVSHQLRSKNTTYVPLKYTHV